MAFKVRKTPYRAWPVTVRLLEGDAAGNVATLEQTFVAHFKPFSEAEYAEIVAAVEQLHPAAAREEKDGKAPNHAAALARNANFFGRVLVGWGSEVQDADGNPLPFSQGALADLVTGPDGLAISGALVQAIGELRYGVAPEKNLKPSPAPGESSGGQGEGQTSLPPT